DEEERDDAAAVLAWVLERTLRLLHPVMPFVTEEVWQRFGIGETIVRAVWPDAGEHADHEAVGAEAEDVWPFFEDLVTSVRRSRAELQIPPRQELEDLLLVDMDEARNLLDRLRKSFEREVLRLTGTRRIGTVPPGSAPDSVRIVVRGRTVLLPVGDIVDLQAARDRVEIKLSQVRASLERARSKLENRAFVENA